MLLAVNPVDVAFAIFAALWLVLVGYMLGHRLGTRKGIAAQRAATAAALAKVEPEMIELEQRKAREAYEAGRSAGYTAGLEYAARESASRKSFWRRPS